MEEIARADASCALVLSMANSLSILSLMSYGTREQQDEWLPRIVSGECIACFTLTEPQAGSNPAAIRRRPCANVTSYILRGNKQFISLGSVVSLAFVFALTDPEAGAKGISCFLVPTNSNGFSVVRKEDKLGLRASDTCQIAFDDIEVSESQMLGKPGEGYRIALARTWREPHRRRGAGDRRRGGRFEQASAYARERESFGQKLIEHQAHRLSPRRHGDRTAGGAAADAHAAELKDRGEQYAIASSMAKALRGRNVRTSLLRRDPGVRRLWLHEGLSGREAGIATRASSRSTKARAKCSA